MDATVNIGRSVYVLSRSKDLSQAVTMKKPSESKTGIVFVTEPELMKDFMEGCFNDKQFNLVELSLAAAEEAVEQVRRSGFTPLLVSRGPDGKPVLGEITDTGIRVEFAEA